MNSCNRFTIVFNSFSIRINFTFTLLIFTINLRIVFNNLRIDIFINFVNNSCVVIRNCGLDIVSNHCIIGFNLSIDCIFYICDCCTNFTIQFLDSIFISRDTFRMMNNVAINVIKTLIMTIYASFKTCYITFNAINLNIYITNLRINCVVNLFVVFIDFTSIFLSTLLRIVVLFSVILLSIDLLITTLFSLILLVIVFSIFVI